MLNQTCTCKNPGITRTFEEWDDIQRPLKAGCGKLFAVKMRARIPEKATIAGTRGEGSAGVEIGPQGKASEVSILLKSNSDIALMLSIMISAGSDVARLEWAPSANGHGSKMEGGRSQQVSKRGITA